MNHKYHLLASLIAASFASSALSATADTSSVTNATPAAHAASANDILPANNNLEKMTVTADRIAQTKQAQTRVVETVSREALDEIQPNSVADALKYAPNVTIAGGAVPGNQSVNIRGLQGNKILQVSDGTRQNLDFDHRPSYFIDPALLSDIQVIKGPISSLYGSGAIGGVVSQNTLSASDLLDENGIGGRVKAGYQSNGDIWSTTGAVAGKTDLYDFLIGGTFQEAHTMEQGNGSKLYGTRAENTSGLAKFNINLTPEQVLGISYRYSDMDGHPPSVGDASGLGNTSSNLISRDTEDQKVQVNYDYTPDDNPWIDLSANIFYNDTEITEHTSGYIGDDVSQYKTRGFNLSNQSTWNDVKFLIGADGYHDELKGERAVNPNDTTGNRPIIPDGAETDNFGIYAYINYALLDNLSFDAGIRYDDFESSSDDANDSNESEWSSSAGIHWQSTDWMALSLRYDEAFRAPSLNELYITGTHFSMGEVIPGIPVTNTFVSNPDLSPEKSHNIEFKADFNFDDVFAAEDALTFSGSYFYNRVEDFINLDVNMAFDPFTGDGGTSTYKNVDNAKIKGFELTSNYQLGGFNAGLAYGQTRGKDDDTHDWLDNMPADKWTLDLSYDVWAINTKFGTRTIFAESQERITDGDVDKYDSYTLMDLYATWEPMGALDGLSVDFTLSNALDENYQTAWSNVYEPGQNFKLSAQYDF